MKNKGLNISIRIILTLGLIWVIYKQLDNRAELLADWRSHVGQHLTDHWFFLLLTLLLFPANYLLEAKKWHILVNRFEKHSFELAVKGILTGTTTGIMTPGRMGDFIGKLMFISPKNNWKAVWSNLPAGIAQNIVILIGGLAGLFIMMDQLTSLTSPARITLVAGTVLISLILVYIYYHLSILNEIGKRLPSKPYLRPIKKSVAVVYSFESSTLNKVLFLSLLRYMVFLLQYVFILSFWGVSITWLVPFAISVIYLVQTLIPLPPVLGLFFRGEIALVLLASFSTNGLLIMSAAFSLWIINLMLPALLGLIYMYRTNILRTLGYEK